MVNETFMRKTIGSIIKTSLMSYFYIGLHPNEKKGDLLSSVVVSNLKNSKKVIGVLNVDQTIVDVNTVTISEGFALYLDLKVGDEIELQKVYNISDIQQIEVIPLRKSNETEQDFNFKIKNMDGLKLSRQLSQTLNFCYLYDGYTMILNGTPLCFKFKDVRKKYGQVSLSTYFFFNSRTISTTNLKSISGQDQVIHYLNQIIAWPRYYKEEFQKLDINMPKGILIYGPPGTGKTHILRELVKDKSLNVTQISGPELLSKYVGQSQASIRKIFDNARNKPGLSIILFDQIDSIASKREAHHDSEAKLVSQLLTCMDGIKERGSVLVIATTNMVNRLDPALRRPGRFDREIKLGIPNITERRDLLRVFLKDLSTQEIDLDELAYKTNGFVHADLQFLCNEAKLNVIDRLRLNKDKVIVLKKEDFQNAMARVPVSALKQYNIVKNQVRLEDVVGYEEVKNRMFTQISFPLRYPQIYKKLKLKSIKGIILNGPPGTGKTTLSKALADKLNHNFMFISTSDILDKYVGQTETKIKELFDKARATQPCIVFIDQIDGLFGSNEDEEQGGRAGRSSALGTFLSQMDGISQENDDLILIGTTNKIKKLGNAMLRAGRFELVLTMDYPTVEELKELYKFYFSNLNLEGYEHWDYLINYSKKNNFTGADVCSIKRIVVNEFLNNKKVEQIKEFFQNPTINIEKIISGAKLFVKNNYNKESSFSHAY